MDTPFKIQPPRVKN